MSKLFVFGDSFSTPEFCVDPVDSWWGLMSTSLDVDAVYNYSWPGNNLENISHCIIENYKLFGKNDYVVVAIPPLLRFTMFDPPNSSDKTMSVWDKNKHKTHTEVVFSHTGLIDLSLHQMDRKFIEYWDPSWAEAIALKTIILLLAYLEKVTDNILIANASVPFIDPTEWPPLKFCQEQVFSDPRVELYNTYYSVNLNKHVPVDFKEYGWQGHHGAEGNREWFESVLMYKMKELKWL